MEVGHVWRGRGIFVCVESFWDAGSKKGNARSNSLTSWFVNYAPGR